MSSTRCNGDGLWHCHICNLDVPGTHIQDHNESWEHNAFVSICQESLKRLNEYIIDTKSQHNTEVSSSYFCYICSVVVDFDESLIHQNCVQHTQSKIKEKVLDNFLKLYINGPKLDEFFYNQVNNNILDAVKLYETIKLNRIISEKEKVESIVTVSKDESHDQTNESQLVTKISNDYVKTVDGYLRDDNERESNDDTKETLDDQEQTVNLKENIIICKICEVNVPKKNWKSHEKGMKHRQKLREIKAKNDNRFEHYHMQRSDNPFIVICRICSIEVPEDSNSVYTHLQSSEHTAQYENLLKTNKIEKTNNRFVCLVCDSYMINKYELYHINSRKHKQALKFNGQTSEGDFNTVINDLLNDDMRNRVHKLYECKLGEHDLNEHNLSEGSAQNILTERWAEDSESVSSKKELEDTSSVSMIESDIGNLRNKTNNDIPINRTSKSITNRSKRLRIAATQGNLDPNLEMREHNTLHCKVCNVNISNKPSKTKTHLKSMKHFTEHQLFLCANKLKVNSKCLHCDLCDEDIDGRTVYEHIGNELHRAHVENLIKYENKLKQGYTKDAKYNRLECVICDDKSIFYNCQGMIDLHFADVRHMTKHDHLLSDNKMEIVNDSFCYCNVCDKDVEVFHDVEHINSSFHRSMLRRVAETI